MSLFTVVLYNIDNNKMGTPALCTDEYDSDKVSPSNSILAVTLVFFLFLMLILFLLFILILSSSLSLS